MMATHALLDAAMVTENPVYRRAAERGVRFLEQFHGGVDGWRYEPKGAESDTSATCLAMRALRLGELAGFKVNAGTLRSGLGWIAKMTDKDGRVGYNTTGGGSARPPGGAKGRWPIKFSRAMEATALLTHMLIWNNPRDKRVRPAADVISRRRPSWSRDAVDMYYWLWGTMAMHQVGGKHWKLWKKALLAAVLPHQSEDGSWPPDGPWGLDGGRIYSTAFTVLMLETGYRHARAK